MQFRGQPRQALLPDLALSNINNYEVLIFKFERDREIFHRRSRHTSFFHHTCKSCSRLDYFTDQIDDPNIKIGHDLPPVGSVYRQPGTVITDPYHLHLFRVCMLAYGVGYWKMYTRIQELSRYPIDVLEWTAHVEIGTWDLTLFWGFHFWAPGVKQLLQGFHTRSRAIHMTANWPPFGDPLLDLFIEPFQFYPERHSQPDIYSALRKQFEAPQNHINHALKALGHNPNLSEGGSPNDYFAYTLGNMRPNFLGYNGKLPLISAHDNFFAISDMQVQDRYLKEMAPTEYDALLLLERQVEETGGDFSKVLELFNKKRSKKAQSELRQSGIHVEIARIREPQSATELQQAMLPAVNIESSESVQIVAVKGPEDAPWSRSSSEEEADSDSEYKPSKHHQVGIQNQNQNVVANDSSLDISAALNNEPEFVFKPLPSTSRDQLDNLLGFVESHQLQSVGYLAMSMTKIDELLQEVQQRTGYLHRYYHENAAVMSKLSTEARYLIEQKHSQKK